MRSLRPRSLSSLLISGLIVLIVPVGIALVQAALQLGLLAKETDRLVRQGVELANYTQALFRYVAAYERTSNLYLVLGDERVLEAGRSTQRQISDTADLLARLELDDEGQSRLDALRASSSGVLAILEFADPLDPSRASRLTERLDEVNLAAASLAERANSVLDQRLRALELRASDTRETLLLWLAALMAVPVVSGVLFTLGVLRPLRAVDRAITSLGHGTFSKPISISGPSDIEALGRQLEWLRVRLLELAQEKNRFLRHMSHELKTPLANIREGTDLLLDGAVGAIDAPQREVTDIMRENALRLQHLIENLLSYSAWQSQVTGLDLSRFALEAELGASFRAQRLALTTRQIRTKADVEHVEIVADRAKIRLVFDNLLSNAIKFTPETGTIYVRARRHDATIVIDFADSGPGIPPEDRDRVFEAFYTGSTPQAGHLKGSGIGLSIVAEFVAAHGGRVELDQGEFSGAHFRIWLPVEPGESLAPRTRVHD